MQPIQRLARSLFRPRTTFGLLNAVRIELNNALFAVNFRSTSRRNIQKDQNLGLRLCLAL